MHQVDVLQITLKFHRSSLMSSSGGLTTSTTAADDSGNEGPLLGAASLSSVEQDVTMQEAIQVNKE